MVWGSFAVLTQICTLSLVYWYPQENYISLDSQRRMLNHDINVVNISDEIKTQTKREFRNYIYFFFFFN